VPGRAAVAPGSATPELDSTHMNGLIDDKKRSVVPTVQSKCVCLSSGILKSLHQKQSSHRPQTPPPLLPPHFLLFFSVIIRMFAYCAYVLNVASVDVLMPFLVACPCTIFIVNLLFCYVLGK